MRTIVYKASNTEAALHGGGPGLRADDGFDVNFK